MSKWLEPSGYFGPYFGADGEAIITGVATFSVAASGTISALQAEASGAGANTYTLSPKTREQWEAERAAARVQESEAFTEREQAPEVEQVRPLKPRPVRVPLPLLFQEPKPITQPMEAPAAVRQVPPVQVVADFPVSDEELAAIALVLTARANAYRRVNTGNNQPLVAA